MKKTTVILLLICFVAPIMTALSKAPENKPLSADIPDIVLGNNGFALDLYHQLCSEDGNLFFSPFSISSALGMTYAGARGNTAQEMQKALVFPEGDGVHPAFGELLGDLSSAEPRLDIANALSLTGGEISESYKSLIMRDYSAEIFRGDLDKINSWVNQKTNGKIKKILDQLDPNSVCVLLNAIYFKGDWQLPFSPHSTHEAPFFVTFEQEAPVEMMFQESRFKLLEDDGFQALALPYKGKPMSMVIFLPNEIDGISELESKFNAKNLEKWLSGIDSQQPEKVKLYIPKFKLETEYSLVPTFRKLGVKDAFTPDVADFRGMGWEVGELWISQIKHKAFVEVDEEGTEAAAATAVEMATRAVMPQPTPIFRADHPFIFLIRDDSTGSILFIGRMNNPKTD